MARSTALYEVQPTYDALGNVIESVTTLPQGVDTQVFCYDDLSRLTWAGSSGTPACSGAPTPSDTGSLSGTGAQYSASYAYDSLNRLTSSPLGAYTYGDSAHADAATAIGSGGSAWTASYDASGNMTCRAASGATTCSGASPTGAQLAYDNQGQLAQWLSAPTNPTSSATYLYDGEGHRVQQVTASGGTTTTTSYIGSLEEVTTDGATTTTTTYYGGLALSVNGALSYTLSDGLGSVSESVNASSGVVSATQLYGPYGSVRYQSGALPTSYGYTHQRSDAVSGLDYYNARYYDPLAGQFTSADTTLAGGLNRYAYVGGNPETWVDPSGHSAAACDSPMCGGTSDFPDGGPAGGSTGGTGVRGVGAGGVATAPPETEPETTSEPSVGGSLTMGGSRTSLGIVLGLFALSIGAILYATSQAIWNAWQQSRTIGTSPTGSSSTSTSGSGGGSGSGSGSGSGNGSGSGTTPCLPPPTENGQASGFGAPILSDSVIPECDPQLAMEALCIGYTSYSQSYIGGYLAKAAPPYGPLNGIVDGVYINHRGIAEPWRAWYDPAGRIIARTDYTAGNRAAGIPPVHYHLFYWNSGAMPGQAPQHFPSVFEPDEWPMWAPQFPPGE